MRKILAIGVVSVLLCSCVSLLPSSGDPTKRYTLDSLADNCNSKEQSFHAVHPHQLIVDLPTVYPPIDSTRVALRPTEQLIDYYADVEWADRLSTLIQDSLIYSFQCKSALRAVSRPTEGFNANYALKVEVRKFFIDHSDPKHTPVAKVDYVIHLIKLPERKVVTSHQFSHNQTIPEYSMDNIIKSLNMAQLEVTKSLVPWIINHMH
jgi:ABC-type uncharacterized transport system auxiliary subunit